MSADCRRTWKVQTTDRKELSANTVTVISCGSRLLMNATVLAENVCYISVLLTFYAPQQSADMSQVVFAHFSPF
jgi:hypothetical protein